MIDTNQELDARGLNCPLPILRTKKAIAAMASGETLRVIASDPGSVKDMESFCRQTGNPLIASEQQDDDFVFVVERA